MKSLKDSKINFHMKHVIISRSRIATNQRHFTKHFRKQIRHNVLLRKKNRKSI